MKEVSYNKYAKEVLAQLEKGAFLNVKCDNQINTMTIGWGSISYIWGKPIFVVLVRYSRYTYEMIEKTNEFTISFPINVDMKKELIFCGTKSKRDYDKFKECNLTPIEGQKVDTPIIGECDLHYECRIVYKQKMQESELDSTIVNKCYGNNDYHVLYYGEIVSCYTNSIDGTEQDLHV